MVGIYADCNLSDRSFRARAEKVIDISFNRLIDAIRVVPQVKQFELRIAKRPGLPSEIASLSGRKGCTSKLFLRSSRKDRKYSIWLWTKPQSPSRRSSRTAGKPPRKQPRLRPKRSHLTRLPHRLGEAPSLLGLAAIPYEATL